VCATPDKSTFAMMLTTFSAEVAWMAVMGALHQLVLGLVIPQNEIASSDEHCSEVGSSLVDLPKFNSLLAPFRFLIPHLYIDRFILSSQGLKLAAVLTSNWLDSYIRISLIC
jgi:hypothetical protein